MSSRLVLRRSAKAFSLLELLVVVGIVGTLAALVIPALGAARESARRVACQHQMMQIALAAKVYAQDHNLSFPCMEADPFSGELNPAPEWWRGLLPYGLAEKALKCPSDPYNNEAAVKSSYVYNEMFARGLSYQQLTAAAQKIIVSERSDQDNTLITYPAWKGLSQWISCVQQDRHGSDANYLYADGHVETKVFMQTVGAAQANDHCNDTNQHFVSLGPCISGCVVRSDTGAGVDGITVTLSSGASTVTSGGGYYSHGVSYGWAGTATPSFFGIGVFSPVGRSYTAVTSSQTGQDYGWMPPLMAVSGRVTRSDNGAGWDGATVTFSNGGGTVVTSGGGYYSANVAWGWSGVATPFYSVGGFGPANRSYGNITSNTANQDYSWIPPIISVSGRITWQGGGGGIDGKTVTFSNGGGSATTAGGGYYTRNVPYGYTGTATPSGVVQGFLPANRSYSNLIASAGGQDYLGRGIEPP